MTRATKHMPGGIDRVFAGPSERNCAKILSNRRLDFRSAPQMQEISKPGFGN
jgi:hypothetical protein